VLAIVGAALATRDKCLLVLYILLGQDNMQAAVRPSKTFTRFTLSRAGQLA
jgi:hypothetical protein